QPLWEISLALGEALEMDAVESSVSVKNLLRSLDREIKLLVVHGVRALKVPADDELLRNLLYYVARSGKNAASIPENSHLFTVYNKYRLETALLEGKGGGPSGEDMLTAPDPEAMRSVITALKFEIESVKKALSDNLAGEVSDQALVEAVSIIKRVADTLAVLGIGNLRREILEQGAALELVIESSSALSQDRLIAI